MKNLYAIRTVFLLSAIFTTSILFAQTTHTITLTCNTTNISNENVNSVCSFGQGSESTNEDYTTEVNIGDIIVWRGVAVNDSGLSSTIELHQVNHEGGVNVFGQNTLIDNNGIISGEVVQGQPGDVEKYNLKFRVNVNGSRVGGTFLIDPKIKIIQLSVDELDRN